MATSNKALQLSADKECGLTPRSSRAPTAGHQARAGGTRYILASPGLASRRWRRLSSNVRHQKVSRAVLQQEVRLSAWIEQPRGGQAAEGLRYSFSCVALAGPNDGLCCVMNQLVNFSLSHVSASREVSVALSERSISQFFGPAAVGGTEVSLNIPSGGRQVTDRQAWSARSGAASRPGSSRSAFPVAHCTTSRHRPN